MEIKIREVRFGDIYRLSEILDKMGIKLDISALLDEAKKNPNEAQSFIGGQIFLLLISKLYLAQKQINALISSMTEIPMTDIEQLGIKETKEVLMALINQVNWADLFQSATVE